MKIRLYIVRLVLMVFILLLPNLMLANVRFESVPGMEVKGDFVVEPALKEIVLQPGETDTFTLRITNRSGRKAEYDIGVFDIDPSISDGTNFAILEDEAGPYPLRQLVKIELTNIQLDHGQSALVPVTITWPSNLDGRGLYGVVAVSMTGEADNKLGNIARIRSRIGIGLFVRAAGTTKSVGVISKFSTANGGILFLRQPTLAISYTNQGQVHSRLVGRIDLINNFGIRTSSIEIEPWLVLPNSTRSRTLATSSTLWPGLYKANLELDVDNSALTLSKSIFYVIIPYWLWALIILTMIIITFRMLRRKIVA